MPAIYRLIHQSRTARNNLRATTLKIPVAIFCGVYNLQSETFMPIWLNFVRKPNKVVEESAKLVYLMRPLNLLNPGRIDATLARRTLTKEV